MPDQHVETSDGDPGRIAMVLPGSGYRAEHPLLEYPSRALEDAGWSLRTVVWDRRPESNDLARTAYERVVRESVRTGARCLVLGKSLGTLALPLSRELGVPGAWITPLLSEHGDPDVRRAALALAGSGVDAVLAGSRADPTWDADVAARSGAHVVEIADADHRLSVRGDWRASLAMLERVTEAVEALARRVERSRPDGRTIRA